MQSTTSRQWRLELEMNLRFAALWLVSHLSPLVLSNEIIAHLTSCNSNGDPLTLLQPVPVLHDLPVPEPSLTLKIDSTISYQTILGYGAGLPQSSAYVLSQLKSLSLSIYEAVLMKLFDPIHGAGLTILRFPMGSCDFSLTNTSYDEVFNDYNLTSFEIDPETEIMIATLQDILLINPNITLIASPWSAPSWLKEWNSLLGLSEENTLLSTEEAYQTYGNYFKLTYETFRSKGLQIKYFTLQNEPLFGDNKLYPGMYFTAEHEYRLGRIVSELLGEEEEVKLLAYDHNWDHPEYPLEILSRQSGEEKKIFDGVAWHCYGGEMTKALEEIRGSYPAASQHITECTGSFPSSTCDITQGMTSFGWNHEWDMQNLFLGAAGVGSSSGTKWIIALDENCGPVLPGVEYTFGRPFVSIPLSLDPEVMTFEDVKWNQDYWTTAHMSKFISPQDVRIQTTLQEGGNYTKNFLSEAFYNLKTHQVTCLLMNLNHDGEEEPIVTISQGSTLFHFQIPQWSTVIFQWYDQEY
jgi:glucosylceramidase